MWRSIAVFLILGLVVGCGSSDQESVTRDPDADRAAIEGLANRLEKRISDLDAEGASEGVRRDSSVVYVSNGTVIRGVDYVPTLQSYYSTLDSLQFVWTRTEISFPTPTTAVLIGWASIREKTKEGAWASDPAIFTIFYRVNDEGRWEFFAAHKTGSQD
jgi:hypothetical protein